MTDLAALELFPDGLDPGPGFARELDEIDSLYTFRDRFELPSDAGGQPSVYLAGNSLGPMPVAAREAVERVAAHWSGLGVDGWFEGSEPWYEMDEGLLPSLTALVGARPGEVAVMNGLSVNLHLLLASFFRPEGERRRILVDGPCFPSDRYVAETHLRWHGLDPESELVEVEAGRDGEHPGDEAIEETIEAQGHELAVVLLGGVNFLTGRWPDVARLARAARRAGAIIGLDLAHAVGNVPLSLHDWDVDFAAWCHYKYVNAGPGAPAGIFVHERHATGGDTLRLGGWWGTDPATRFRMRESRFVPRPGATGWQVSCPSALAMAPLGPALALFDEAGMEAVRRKSVRLTSYLEWMIAGVAEGTVEVLTPRDPARRGAQLSLRVRGSARSLQETLQANGIVGDVREPDVLRLAPAPLFNTFHEMWRTAQALRRALGGRT